MSSTFSSCVADRSRYGYADVTTRWTSSTVQSSTATIATTCWASTSSGERGIAVASIARSRISFVTTAHSTRSARNFGNRRPFETCESVWPARPTRCRPRATDFGDSICTTRSTAPMSMPSSSELVATRHFSRPDFSSSSISVRASRDSEPWWERATSLLGEVVQPQRQPLGQAAVVDEHDRGVVLAHHLEHAGIDAGPDRAAAGGVAVDRHARGRMVRRGVGLGVAQVGDGHDDLEVERLVGLRLHDRHRPGPRRPVARRRRGTARSRRSGAAWRTGRCAGAAPRGRWRGRAPRAARASAQVGARACSPPRRGSRRRSRTRVGERLARSRGEHQVERLGRRDQDVGRAAQQRRALLLGRVARADADA